MINQIIFPYISIVRLPFDSCKPVVRVRLAFGLGRALVRVLVRVVSSVWVSVRLFRGVRVCSVTHDTSAHYEVHIFRLLFQVS